jgi:pSer/pThr/pTyr-binding forkhead associated (FHA) protein
MPIIREFLEQAHKLDRDGFISRNNAPVLLQQDNKDGVDPRNEYRSTLKMKINHESKEIQIEPLPPTPIDPVFVIRKSDRNSFASKILIGRTETNDIVIPHITVSKHHAYFKDDPEANRYTITDTGSTNGTQLNGQPISPKDSRYLSDGDQICFGEVHYIFYTAGGFYDLLKSLSALL